MWADAAAGHYDDDDGLGWLAASERSSTSASSTPGQPKGLGVSRRGEWRRKQQVRQRLAKEVEGKELDLDDFSEVAADALLLQCQKQLGRGLTSVEVKVLQSLGARARACIASRPMQ